MFLQQQREGYCIEYVVVIASLHLHDNFITMHLQDKP
jgi:hypothetical protein